METITAVHRNRLGEIINFVTSGGRVISYRKALIDIETGLLEGVRTHQDVDGTLSILPETNPSFDQYPTLF